MKHLHGFCAFPVSHGEISSLIALFVFKWLQVSMKTEVTWIRDMLHGDDVYELQVKLLKQVPEEYPYKNDE